MNTPSPCSNSCRDPYRKGKLPLRALAILTVASLAVVFFLEADRSISGDPRQSEKTAARDLMKTAMHTIKAERGRLGIPIDPMTDPGDTGLIGAA